MYCKSETSRLYTYLVFIVRSCRLFVRPFRVCVLDSDRISARRYQSPGLRGLRVWRAFTITPYPAKKPSELYGTTLPTMYLTGEVRSGTAA